MSSPNRPGRPRVPRIAVGLVLLLLGIALAGLAALTRGSEQHSYSGDGVPPDYARVTAGHDYSLSVPGGTGALADLGQDPQSITCEYVTPDGTRDALEFTPESSDSNATTTFGRFSAPVDGRIGVDCLGYGRVFVDDADDASFDLSGLALVLSVIALTVGAGLTLSAVRSAGAPREQAAADR